MEDAGHSAPRPLLPGSVTVDVAIVGAGFTGLWTAYELLRRDPSLQVMVLERERVGFGASGRNGSWCVPELNAALLARRFGRGRALALHRAMSAAVDEIGRSCEREGIAANFERAGMMLVARGPGQLPALRAAHREYQEQGLGDSHQLLGPAEMGGLPRVAGVEAAIFTPEGACLHPGRLVRGLAAAVERRGGTIHEGTAVTAITPGPRPELLTAFGRVRAEVVVLAMEAYLAEFPGQHRRVLPVYSLIEVTEPLSDQQLAQINWKARVCVSSMRLTVDYLALTPDHRVLVGGRGAPYRFGSRIAAEGEAHARTHRGLRAMFRSWFPELSELRFTHSWGGVLGMPRDWIPQVRLDRATGIATAYGYTGHGVATTNLAGRILADLITGSHSELTELPIVGHRSPLWEPEPMRWLAVRYTQAALARLDARAEAGGRPPSGRTLAERLAAH
jgi:glycine/D-amino acid oxidase-like deaminating enzyme